MTLRFACTACGRCCHDLRLPLALGEVPNWLERGGEVEILADAAPFLPEQPNDPGATYRRDRALLAASGNLAIAVNVTPAATFSGPFLHLRSDVRCGASDERPSTCRIYPAELLPGRLVVPANKACPPEAWGSSGPSRLSRASRPTDLDVARAVKQAQAK